MAQTVIPFGDVKAQKKWSANLAVDVLSKAYFSKKFIGVGSNNIIEQKTDLESDQGDRISFDLSVQLRNAPTEGDSRVEGREENLKFYSDEVNIDQTRHIVSAGGRMTRKRTAHDMRKVARDRLGDYWAEYMDQLMFIYLSGARGINADFIEPTSFAGRAGNALHAPDSTHQFYGGSITAPASMTTADKMSRSAIEIVATSAQMMRANDPDTANMMPVTIDGEEHYVMVMSPLQEHDLRTTATSNEWLDIQKAAAAAEGSKNKIFKGGMGMINNTILHQHKSAIRFNNYGASYPAGSVEAARALFMGRQAGVVAYGTPKGAKFSWFEKLIDGDNEPIVIAGTIVGVKKTRFNGRDFGVIALDTAAKHPKSA